MDPELVDRLRDDLRAADFTVGAVQALLGVEADEARQRGVFAPARRVLEMRAGETRADESRATLIRLCLLGERLDASAVDAALPGLGAAGARELGLVEQTDGALAAVLSLSPVEVADPRIAGPLHWWILSDLDDQLRRGLARPDHVMGVGGATRSLIAQLPPGGSSRALDLGTGCGIVALHLALRGEVVATDISGRALDFARANARLNGVAGIEFLQGDLFAPISGERFDLIASNPPFVVTPRIDGEDASERYEYRDGGMVGDGLAERVVREAPRHLAAGGTLLCLANWESHWGVDGLERVRGWLPAGPEFATWVIERDRVSPLRYAEPWARDGGARSGDAGFDGLIRRWTDDFAARRVVALGLGSIRLHHMLVPHPDTEAVIRVEQAEGAYSAAPGTVLADVFAAGIETARLSDDEILDLEWLVDDAVTEHREHRPGQESPNAIALSTHAGIARRVAADPLLAAAVGACDGELSLRQIAAALVTLLELDGAEHEIAEALVEGVRELVWLGMLRPAAR